MDTVNRLQHGRPAWRAPALLLALLTFTSGCDDVDPAGVPIRLNMPGHTLEAVGDSVQLDVLHREASLAAEYTSLDPEIVSVSASGLARARAAGTARIHAAVGPHTVTGEVTVLPPADIRVWETAIDSAGEGQEKVTLRMANIGGRGFYRLEIYRRGPGGTSLPVRIDLNDNPAPVGMDILFTTWLSVPEGAWHSADWIVVRSREANGTEYRPTECQILYGAGYCVIP